MGKSKMDSTMVELIRDFGDQVGKLSASAVIAIKDSSPIIWDVVRQRLIAEAIMYELLGVILIISSAVLLWLGIKCVKDWKEEKALALIAPVGIVLLCLGITFIICNIITLLSLDYATAGRIVELIK